MKKFLSFRWVSIIFFIAAVIAKMGLLRIFLQIGYDKAALLLTAKNFIHGHGISIGKTAMSDVSEKFYQWYIGWPPGYCLIISPFLYFLEDHYMLACFLVDCIAVIIFFWYLRKILLQINFPAWLVNLFILCQGLFIHSYIESSHPTDFLAMALFLAALFYFIRLVISDKINPGLVLLSIFFFYLSALMRYQYIAIALFLPLLLLFTGIVRKKSVWIKQSSIMFLALLAGIIALLLFQKMNSGQMVYYQVGKKGFYPENVLYMSPFFLTAFYNLNFYTLQLALKLNTSYSFIASIAVWISLPFAVIFLYIYARFFFRKLLKVKTAEEIFFLYAGAASAVTIGLLVYLAISISGDVGPPYKLWTYVMDNRYFALPMLFLQIVAWWWLLIKQALNKSFFIQLLRIILVVSLITESFHTIYFLGKSYSKPMTTFDNIIKETPEVSFVCDFIANEKTLHPDKIIAVASAEVEIEYFADWYGANAVFVSLKTDKNIKLNTSRPVTVVMAIDNKTFPSFRSLLAEVKPALIGTGGNYYFYKYELAP